MRDSLQVEPAQIDSITRTANLVTAYVAHNAVPRSELSALISQVHAAFVGLAAPTGEGHPSIERASPAQIRKSIGSEVLISFVDGKPYKTLKRHLGRHGMTFEQYRVRFGLPHDYPATAPSYSERRSAIGKSLWFGQRRNARKAEEIAVTVGPPPKTRGRRKAGEPPGGISAEIRNARKRVPVG